MRREGRGVWLRQRWGSQNDKGRIERLFEGKMVQEANSKHNNVHNVYIYIYIDCDLYY